MLLQRRPGVCSVGTKRAASDPVAQAAPRCANITSIHRCARRYADQTGKTGFLNSIGPPQAARQAWTRNEAGLLERMPDLARERERL